MQTKFLSCMLYNVSTRHAQVSFILQVADTLTQVFTLLYVLFWNLKKRDIHICVGEGMKGEWRREKGGGGGEDYTVRKRN